MRVEEMQRVLDTAQSRLGAMLDELGFDENRDEGPEPLSAVLESEAW